MNRIVSSISLVALCALLSVSVVPQVAPRAAQAQSSIDCHASFIIYNDEPALHLLWIDIANNGAFFNPAELVGYTGRRGVTRETSCSPFDAPCPGDEAPLGLANYRLSDGVGRLLTQATESPPGELDPILQIGVTRSSNDPGEFGVDVALALDSFARDVVPQPLVCVESVRCPGSDVGFVNEVPSACGDPTGDRRVTATDALAALLDAVELPELGCMGVLSACDANNDGAITVTDALHIMNAAAFIDVQLHCPLPPNCG